MLEAKESPATGGEPVNGAHSEHKGALKHDDSTGGSALHWTLWRDVSGTKKADRLDAWPAFCGWLESLPPAAKKDQCQLIKLARFGDTRSNKGALRHDANVIEVTGIEGDYDSEAVTPARAIELLEAHQLRAAIAPTFSSTPEGPRWRVLTPLANPIPPADRLRYVEILNGMLGGILATESGTLSQSYYVGVPEGAGAVMLHTFDDPVEGHTLDELEVFEDLDSLRVPVNGSGKAKKPGTEIEAADVTGFDDWVNELCTGDSVHPSAVRIAASLVAKGWRDDDIRLLFTGLADRVEAERGKERADLLRGKELADAIRSAHDKGFAPRAFEDVLADARELTEDSEEIEQLAAEASQFSAVQNRRILDAIKRATRIPLGTLKEAQREARGDSEEPDDLEFARDLANTMGRENVLCAQAFVWHWKERGVWHQEEDRAVRQWVQHHLSNNKDAVSKANVDSVTDLFRTEVYSPDREFNVGPAECVNTLNGELMLNDSGEWELHPHNREHYRTTQIPLEYDPQATAPRFMAFLGEVFAGDPDAGEKAQAVLEMIGYSLMAHCRYERFVILVGSGANGKSVLLSVLEALLGTENVAGVQPSQFDRSFQRAHLHGKLANIVTEIKQGEVIDDASLKGIVSGEPTTVEHKFKDPFVMRPFSTCWFGTNHMPHTRDFSDALFRRALVVEFNNVFKPDRDNHDPRLKEKLMGELPGILNMALSEYASAVQTEFTMPQSCGDARERWRLEADQVAQFLESECSENGFAKVEPQKLFKAYREWAQDVGIHKIMAQRGFLDRVKALGYETRKTNGKRWVTGLECHRTVVEFDRIAR